jgi:hypothetical protein
VSGNRPRVRFTVTLEGDRANESANIHTLKFLLKRLLRSRSLECVDAREIAPQDIKHD